MVYISYVSCYCCSVTKSCLTLCNPMNCRLLCPSPSPEVCSNSYPSSQGYHPTISSSAVPFFSCLPSFPASVFSNESALHIRWPNGAITMGASVSICILNLIIFTSSIFCNEAGKTDTWRQAEMTEKEKPKMGLREGTGRREKQEAQRRKD